jgi:hypothetical protein
MIPELEIPEDEPSSKIAPIELLEQLMLLNQDEKERAINFIAASMNLKTISEAKEITGKSYNGIKNFGKVVRLINKNYAVLDEMH